jgi:ABC-type sugar transport system substrate-binding protein
MASEIERECRVKVTFLNPAFATDAFYGKFVHFGRLAAADLGVEFEVLAADSDLDRMRSQVRALTEKSDRPDYVLLVNSANVGAELVPQLSRAELPCFLVCEGFFLAERQLLGKPGQKHPFWLGNLLPDDEQAGYLLAERLIEAARERNAVGADGQIHVLGLSGAYSAAAIQRMSGLRRAVDSREDVVLDEAAPAMWVRETAARHTKGLLSRNKNATVIWAASDTMALGAEDEVVAAGREPGREIVVGGIDWSPSSLEKVETGRFAASVGGHFLDCARAVVMLYDHFNGTELEPESRSTFEVLTKRNCSRYKVFFDQVDPEGLDFSEFSQHRNPELTDYDFSVEAISDRL